MTRDPWDISTLPVVNGMINDYPEVEVNEGYYIITEYWENIEHKKLTSVFTEAPRFFLTNTDAKNINIEIEFLVRAKNLPNPMQGSLNMEIEIKESE